MTQPHVHRALDLAFEQVAVHHAADVMRSDDLLDGPVTGQDDYLGRPAVADVRAFQVWIVHRLRERKGHFADELLPHEVFEPCAVQMSLELLAGPADRKPAQERAARRGGLPSTELALGINPHAHAPEVHAVGAEFLAGHLLHHSVHALPHLGPGVAHQHGPVVLDLDGGEAVLRQAVPHAHVLHRAGDARVLRRSVVVLHREQCLLQPHAGAERLAGSERPPDVECVDPADVPPVDADLLGQTVETPLHREVGLVAAEPAHRAGRWVVRVDGVRLDVHDRYVVGAARVPAGPLQHFVANRGVGPGIAGDPGPDRGEAPALVAAHGVGHPQRVALHVHADGLLARQRELHRGAGHPGEDGGVAVDPEIFLRAERAPVADQRDADAPLGLAEQARDLPPVVPDPLAPGVDAHALFGVMGERRLRLEEGVLDELRLERLRDDVGRAGERLIRGAALDLPRLEQVALLMHSRRIGTKRGLGIGDRLQHLVLDGDRRRRQAGRPAGGRGYGREHVADIARGLPLRDEGRPVIVDAADGAVTRDVLGQDDANDARHGPRTGEVDPLHDGTGMIGKAQRAVQHARQGHVIDERLHPQRQLRAFVARRPRPQSAGPLQPGCHLPGEEPSSEFDRVDDLHVPRAPAEMRPEHLRDLVARGPGGLREEGAGLDDDARRAEPALGGTGRSEGQGERLPLTLGETFERHDRRAGERRGRL